MFQNLKVDIIYYKTNTDFEMEFNLCGCCRMRLLTDKSPDRKTALHSLARAVSRSRIIMVTGGLFGEDGIINLVSMAIGIPLVEIEKKNYGITGDEKIEILGGATPLVTADGYFGGCIIESGPQTMILISENKNIRKTIMQTLIHPYVEELCAVELKEKAAAITDAQNTPEVTKDIAVEETDAPEVAETVIENTNEQSDNTEISVDEPVEETAEEKPVATNIEDTELYIDMEVASDFDYQKSQAEVDAILSSGMIFESDDENFTVAPIPDEVDAPLLVDTEPIDISSESRKKIDEESVKDFIFDGDDYNTTKPRASRSLNVFILIVAVFVLVVLAVLCYAIFYVPTRSGVDVSEYIRETFNTLLGKA